MSLSLSRPDLMRRQNLINGEWADARDARRYPVQNPASDALLAEPARLEKFLGVSAQ